MRSLTRKESEAARDVLKELAEIAGRIDQLNYKVYEMVAKYNLNIDLDKDQEDNYVVGDSSIHI